MLRTALRALLAVALLLSADARGRSGGGGGGGRSGGRVGGGFAPRSRQSTRRNAATKDAPAPAPAASGAHTDAAPAAGHTTVVYGSPGGYGGGMGSTTALMGLSLVDGIMREQRRAEMMRVQLEQQRELGKSAGELEALKAQLATQEEKVKGMQAKSDAEKNEK